MNIYKFAIRLHADGILGRLVFGERENEIVEAKDRFNAKYTSLRVLLILDIADELILVILRSEHADANSMPDEKSIGGFLGILMNDYGWKSHKSKSSKKIFEISTIKQLDIEECKSLLEENPEKTSGYNSQLDRKKLLSESIAEVQLQGDGSIEDYRKSISEGSVSQSVAEALANIDKLHGCDEFKKEMREVVHFIEVNNRLNFENKDNPTPVFPYHYLFMGKKGVSHYKAAVLLSGLFFHLGIIKSKNHVRLDIAKQSDNYNGIDINSLVNKQDTGMIFIDRVTEPPNEVDYGTVCAKLVDEMRESRGVILYVLSYFEERREDPFLEKLKDALAKNINFRIVRFPFYTDEELLAMIRESAGLKQYEILANAQALIAFNIKNGSSLPKSDIDYAIDKIIERAIVEKKFSFESKRLADTSFDIREFAVLTLDDLGFLEYDESLHRKHDSPLDELSSMIGLAEVKARVKQITDFVHVRMKKRELGIRDKKICLHMEFTGNPGTGKTTVARIMGRIFKNLGFLSNGHFTEVTRENLIGPYIGQTLPKVKKVIDDACGGILFIDEAYSLNANAENDFGVEALSYIVKAMEEYKDDLVMIFAGYPAEMDKMVALNPGMHDRIAFKIEFPDYSDAELASIFKLMCAENNYTLAGEAGAEITKFIVQVCKNRGEHFGNARLIRRIFERVEILQNQRICDTNRFTQEDIRLVTLDDIKKLYEDTEIKLMLKEQRVKGNIGFIF
jgi:Holliday junction resolvasome RuvABC ATP-dependent DNA helicase subunit